MVETELGLVDVEKERAIRHAIELGQATLGVTPEALNAVDVTLVANELVVIMMDPQMLLITDVNQAVITTPAVGMDDDLGLYFAPNHGQKRAFGAVGDNLGVDPALAFEDAEHEGLSRRAPASPAAHPARTEVGFVDLDLAAFEGPTLLAFVRQPLTQTQINVVDRADRDPAEACIVRRGEVQGEQPQNRAEFSFIQLRAFEVAVSHGGTEVKSTSCLRLLPKPLNNIEDQRIVIRRVRSEHARKNSRRKQRGGGEYNSDPAQNYRYGERILRTFFLIRMPLNRGSTAHERGVQNRGRDDTERGARNYFACE